MPTDEREEIEALRRVLKRFYSVLEAALVLGVSVSSIRRRIRDGSLGAVRVGGVLRISFNELDRFAVRSRGLQPAEAGAVRKPRVQRVTTTPQDSASEP